MGCHVNYCQVDYFQGNFLNWCSIALATKNVLYYADWPLFLKGILLVQILDPNLRNS